MKKTKTSDVICVFSFLDGGGRSRSVQVHSGLSLIQTVNHAQQYHSLKTISHFVQYRPLRLFYFKKKSFGGWRVWIPSLYTHQPDTLSLTTMYGRNKFFLSLMIFYSAINYCWQVGIPQPSFFRSSICGWTEKQRLDSSTSPSHFCGFRWVSVIVTVGGTSYWFAP